MRFAKSKVPKTRKLTRNLKVKRIVKNGKKYIIVVKRNKHVKLSRRAVISKVNNGFKIVRKGKYIKVVQKKEKKVHRKRHGHRANKSIRHRMFRARYVKNSKG